MALTKEQFQEAVTLIANDPQSRKQVRGLIDELDARQTAAGDQQHGREQPQQQQRSGFLTMPR